MLQAAAAASIEMRTLGNNAQIARADNPSGIGEVVLGMLLPDLQFHRLAGKSTVDENHFTVDARDPAPFVI